MEIRKTHVKNVQIDTSELHNDYLYAILEYYSAILIYFSIIFKCIYLKKIITGNLGRSSILAKTVNPQLFLPTRNKK